MDDEQYWTNRYKNQQTGWDIGYPSTPIKEYFDNLKYKNIDILIPGAGNAHEAEYLWRSGFTNVSVIDLSEIPLNNITQRVSDFPRESAILGNFFDHQGKYDVMVEQTFFCAINPSLRIKYVEQAHHLLNDDGYIVGLMFNKALDGGPPFGGSLEEYKELFTPYFHIEIMEPCYNSIPPRAGNELFVKFLKK
jgi:hypothetical protein